MFSSIKNSTKSIFVALASILIVAGIVSAAGSLDAPSGSVQATYYTLGDIYQKITTGNSAGSHDVSTTSNPVENFYSLSEIYEAIPPLISFDNSTTTIPVGINLATTTLDVIDSDLIASNIATGTNIFGIDGSLDTETSELEWQTPDPGVTKAWDESFGGSGNGAVEYCAGLSTAGGQKPGVAWRLPTFSELVGATIYGDDTTSGFLSVYYWSGIAVGPSNALRVSFASALFTSTGKSGQMYVRCVR